MLYQLTHRTHMGLSVLHVRAPMYTLVKDGRAQRLHFALRQQVPAKLGSSRWRSAESRARSIKSEKADIGADGRLVVTVDPDATEEIPLYVTAPRGFVDAARARRSR